MRLFSLPLLFIFFLRETSYFWCVCECIPLTLAVSYFLILSVSLSFSLGPLLLWSVKMRQFSGVTHGKCGTLCLARSLYLDTSHIRQSFLAGVLSLHFSTTLSSSTFFLLQTSVPTFLTRFLCQPNKQQQGLHNSCTLWSWSSSLSLSLSAFSMDMLSELR